MPIHEAGTVPYAPPSTVIEVVDRFRTRGMTEPFTADVVIKAGVTESLAPRTLQALRLLELIDDAGYSTPTLKALAKATTDEYRPLFAQLVRDVYAEVFAFVDPAVDSLERVEDAFRSYNPRGQRARAVTLFLGLCAHAGIIDESRLPARAVPAGTGKPKVQKPAKTRDSKTAATHVTPIPVGAGLTGLDPALAGVLGRLPVAGNPWTSEDRDAFINALTAVINMLYPVVGTSRVRAALLPGESH